MRYFYYGSEQEDRGKNRQLYRRGNNGRRDRYDIMDEDGLVIEEDTIYEIDWECRNCRRNHGGR